MAQYEASDPTVPQLRNAQKKSVLYLPNIHYRKTTENKKNKTNKQKTT